MIDAPPTREWLKKQIESLLGSNIEPITVNSLLALADAHAHRSFDAGYEAGYSDGCNVCTADHE